MSGCTCARRAALVLAATGALAGLAGCGGGDDEALDVSLVALTPTPVVQLPAPVAPASVGEVVTPGEKTPRPFARALRTRRVSVVAFLLPGAAEDRRVASALRTVEGESGSSGVNFFVYRVGQNRRFGDLADLLGIDGTPTVAVIGRDARLLKRFPGLVDAPILREAVRAARERDPIADAGGEPADDGPKKKKKPPKGSRSAGG